MIWEKMNEEINEFKSALKKNDKSNAEEEFGDILFTLLNIARWEDIDPEESLTKTNKKILERFEHIEIKLGHQLNKSKKNEIKNLWEEAKKAIKQNKKAKDNE